jgi:hypothetical protein
MTLIAKGNGLTVQEGGDLSQNATIVVESEDVCQEATIRTRAPPKCSVYKSLEHNARTCPIRQASN